MKELIKGEDYFFDEKGFFVFTAKYHAARGFCCGYECSECPFDYEAVTEPLRSQLLGDRVEKKKKREDDRYMG